MSRLTRQIHRSFFCIGCDVDTSRQGINEYCMVNDDVWLKTHPEDLEHSMLCIGCLELRIGRKLEPKDFLECPLNADSKARRDRSERLLDRMGAL